MIGSKRICGEQDCGEWTSNPSHPLCYIDYLDFQDGLIDECPNHPGIYKPEEYLVCRQCYLKERKISKTTHPVANRQEGYSTDNRNKPYIEPKAIALSTKAVLRVRNNLNEHKRQCTLHESNTIQYLIDPIIQSLGWDFSNPEEVRREFNPKGGRPFREKAVDIALFEDGVPKVFVEAKRLDRFPYHFLDNLKQIEGYTPYMREEGKMVLTYGDAWFIDSVCNGKTEKSELINIDEGRAEDIARRLHEVIGKSTFKALHGVKEDSGEYRAVEAEQCKSKRPSYDIREDLKEYRATESKRRKRPAYTIFTDETITLISSQKPSSLLELERIKGVGPATLEEHGTSILKIVEGSS